MSRCSKQQHCRVPQLSFGAPTCQQGGFKVLFVPLGHPDFVRKFLEGKIAEHRTFLERIPEIPDTQSAWLLLSFCAASRANFFLRAVNPIHAEQFASSHDEGVWQCLCHILQISPTCDTRSVIVAFVGGWTRSSERTSDATRSPLGELGRRRESDEGAPS